MTPHIDLDLPEYVLGLLNDEHRTRVEKHLHRCDACAGAVASSADALAAYGCAGTMKPSDGLRGRVLREARSCRYRLAPLATRMAEVVHIPLTQAERALAHAFEPAAWQPTPWPRVELMPLERNTRIDTSQVGLLRVAPGAEFPFHTNVSDETFMVLSGHLREHDGHVLCRGAVQTKAAGTAHGFRAGAREPLLAAVMVRGASIVEHLRR